LQFTILSQALSRRSKTVAKDEKFSLTLHYKKKPHSPWGDCGAKDFGYYLGEEHEEVCSFVDILPI
jgi:hypothetical protein